MNEPQKPTPHTKPNTRRLALLGIVVIVVAAVVVVEGLYSRSQNTDTLAKVAAQAAIPPVRVVHPVPPDKGTQIELPGTIQAYYAAPIYARVPGYLKAWYTDIGARVKQGQVLGIIDTPDLDRELDQAVADLAAAKAKARLAQLTAARWKALESSQSVSRQTVDEKLGDADAKQADVEAAQAKVTRLETMQDFKKLLAPFDGIVTARLTDVGKLIVAGGAQGQELFEVSDVHEMRVYVRVPQAYAAMLKPGVKANLVLPQYPGRPFPATLVTTSGAVAETSRTVLVELMAENTDNLLPPGSFAMVDFALPPNAHVLLLPASALIFSEHGMQVAVLTKDNHVSLRKVELGRELGINVEVLSGVTTEDAIVDAPPETLADGDPVSLTEAAVPAPALADNSTPAARH